MKDDVAPKDIIEKSDLSTIPLDLLDELLDPTYAEGLFKYYKESWRKGFPISVLYSALRRHLNQFFFEREDFDKETFEKYGIQKTHLGAIIFCCISMYNSLKLNKGFDDRPYIKKKRENKHNIKKKKGNKPNIKKEEIVKEKYNKIFDYDLELQSDLDDFLKDDLLPQDDMNDFLKNDLLPQDDIDDFLKNELLPQDDIDDFLKNDKKEEKKFKYEKELIDFINQQVRDNKLHDVLLTQDEVTKMFDLPDKGKKHDYVCKYIPKNNADIKEKCLSCKSFDEEYFMACMNSLKCDNYSLYEESHCSTCKKQYSTFVNFKEIVCKHCSINPKNRI